MKRLGLILFLGLSFMVQSQTPKTVIFVHGSWGGGWDYRHMQSLLEQKGFDVYRPTLTGLGERSHLNHPSINLTTHVLDIVNLIKFEELHDVILVGHSYGGMVITGVAQHIPERLGHLLYMDALLPENGESVFDLMDPKEVAYYQQLAANNTGQEWAIPPFWPDWGKDVPHPIGTYQQAITINNPLAKGIPATYVLTIEKGQTVDEFSKFAQRAKSKKWNYLELPTGHNVQRTMPDEYADIISNITLADKDE